MNRLEFKSGGQPIYNHDFRFQFEKLYKAIEDQCQGNGAFVFSGCEVEGTTVNPGLVYIEGKILEFAGKSDVAFPAYLQMVGPVYHEERLFAEDQTSKTTRIDYYAALVSAPPSGESIMIDGNGGARVLAPVVMESNYKEISLSTASFNGWLKYRKIGAQVELHMEVTYTAEPGVNHLFHELEAAYRPKQRFLTPAMIFNGGITSLDMVAFYTNGSMNTYRNRSIDDTLKIHCFYACV